MAQHLASVCWSRRDEGFLQSKFSRDHTWTFDGGLSVPATAAPAVVPPPWTDPAAIDPEEAFVAALASCHLLTFLHVASRSGFTVDRYEDHATGRMAKNEKGIPWVAEVILRPQVTWSGNPPTAAQENELHHKAHGWCYIANSVKTVVTIEPVRP